MGTPPVLHCITSFMFMNSHVMTFVNVAWFVRVVLLRAGGRQSVVPDRHHNIGRRLFVGSRVSRLHWLLQSNLSTNAARRLARPHSRLQSQVQGRLLSPPLLCNTVVYAF